MRGVHGSSGTSHGAPLLVDYEHALVAHRYWVFLWVVLSTSAGILLTTTAHLVYKDTKCMTDADMSTVMGHERVRGIEDNGRSPNTWC